MKYRARIAGPEGERSLEVEVQLALLQRRDAGLEVIEVGHREVEDAALLRAGVDGRRPGRRSAGPKQRAEGPAGIVLGGDALPRSGVDDVLVSRGAVGVGRRA